MTAMKELPLLVILRPPGFDTLTIRIWEAANDSIYTQAAPPALLLIALTLLPLVLISMWKGIGLDRALHDHG
jgi:iron(III) transport system permease protein